MNFSIEIDPSKQKQAIRFGLSAIKNVGEAAIDSILQARSVHKTFHSLTDFFTKVDNQKVNKKVVESLIQVGAFDEFATRAAMLSAYETIRAKASQVQKRKATGQTSLFESIEEKSAGDSFQDDLPEVHEIEKKQLLTWEKELLGFYLTENPFSRSMQLIAQAISYRMHELDPQRHNGNSVVLGGALTSVRKVFTKKNNSEMAFATLEDDTGSVDMVIFPKIFAEMKEKIAQDRVFLCEGRLDYREDRLSLVANKITEVNEQDFSYIEPEVTPVTIEIPRGTPRDRMEHLAKMLRDNPGKEKVMLLLPNGGDIPKKIILPYKIQYTPQLRQKIANLLD